MKKKFKRIQIDTQINNIIIILYIIIQLIKFITPNNKIVNLIILPSPNLMNALKNSIEKNYTDSNILIIMINYFNILITPLYYYFIYGKKRMQIILLILPLYFQYAYNASIGRGSVLIAIIIIILKIYQQINNKKLFILLNIILLVPLIMAFNYYSYVRIGKDTNFDFSANVIQKVFLQETNFPTFYSKVNNSNNYHTKDLFDFIKWLTTLAIPKAIINIPNIRSFAYEISEIITGLNRYDKNFVVILSGVITENTYIFGKYLIFIPALILSIIIVLIHYTFYFYKNYGIYYFYIITYISFFYSRAGVSGIYPLVFNQMILLYIIIILLFLSKKNRYKII
jgi:hypothetical protein